MTPEATKWLVWRDRLRNMTEETIAVFSLFHDENKRSNNVTWLQISWLQVSWRGLCIRTQQLQLQKLKNNHFQGKQKEMSTPALLMRWCIENTTIATAKGEDQQPQPPRQQKKNMKMLSKCLSEWKKQKTWPLQECPLLVLLLTSAQHLVSDLLLCQQLLWIPSSLSHHSCCCCSLVCATTIWSAHFAFCTFVIQKTHCELSVVSTRTLGRRHFVSSCCHAMWNGYKNPPK